MKYRVLRFVALLVLSSLVGFAPSAAVHASEEATCPDDAGPAGKKGTWKAVYDIRSNSLTGPLVFIRKLGFQENGSTTIKKYETYAGTAGKQWLFRWEGNLEGISGNTDAIITTTNQANTSKTPSSLSLPRLTTPNKRCSLQIAPYALSPATGPKVAIVGDSIVNQYTMVRQGRQELANTLAQNYGWRFHVDALGGRPLSSDLSNRSDSSLSEIRGILATKPNVLIVALSTNDALNIAYAKECEGGYGIATVAPKTCDVYTHTSRLQREQNIPYDLAEIASSAIALNVCLVFVTPQTDYARNAFLALLPTIEYQNGVAANVRQQMLQTQIFWTTLYPQAKVGILDWAEYVKSLDFRDTDHLHLNSTGMAWHPNLWISQVHTTCGI